eukprot:4316999-Pyramimonas_sp.AAC.1
MTRTTTLSGTTRRMGSRPPALCRATMHPETRPWGSPGRAARRPLLQGEGQRGLEADFQPARQLLPWP